VRGRLLNGKDIKIIYDEPWFWKVSAYRPPAPRPQHQRPNKVQRPKATIQLENEPELESISDYVAASVRNQRPEYNPRDKRYPPSRSPPREKRFTRCESGSEAWCGYDIEPACTPVSCGMTRMESGSEAWCGYNSNQLPVKPRKLRQTRANLSDFVKPTPQKANQAVSGTTHAILEEGEVEN
jgi:hypothetical protein